MHQHSTSNYIKFHKKNSGLLNCGHIELLFHKLKPLPPHCNIAKHIPNTMLFYLILKQAITDGKADTHYSSTLSFIYLFKRTKQPLSNVAIRGHCSSINPKIIIVVPLAIGQVRYWRCRLCTFLHTYIKYMSMYINIYVQV